MDVPAQGSTRTVMWVGWMVVVLLSGAQLVSALRAMQASVVMTRVMPVARARAWTRVPTRCFSSPRNSPLTCIERDELMPVFLHHGWRLTPGRDAIAKTFEFTDFKDAFAFMTTVAERAEQLNHHPEWFNVYNKVEVTLSTHDAGGLSKLDADMATFMDATHAAVSRTHHPQ